MCEVEFWEVFLSKVLRFFMWLPSNPHVNCRLANLEEFRDTPSGFLYVPGARINLSTRTALPDVGLQASRINLLFPFAAIAAGRALLIF